MKKYDDKVIENRILEAMEILNIKRMPLAIELRTNDFPGLEAIITKTGGFVEWAKKLNLEQKKRIRVWDDEKIVKEIFECMDTLRIKRMPSSSELKSIGKNDLHCALSKSHKRYSEWAKELGLEMKHSETLIGNEFEEHVMDALKEYSNHLTVKRMSTKHPFDLLVNDCVKVDVKVGKAHYHFGSRAHTFALNKKYGSCDVYVCVALDENDQIEHYFVIPARFVQVVTLNIGTESKYNRFKDKWINILNLVYSLESFYGGIS